MAVTMIELTHVPGEELTHIPGEELTHIPGEELTHEPGLPLEYAPKYLLEALGLGHLYNAALSVDNNPLPPTVPHAPKTLPDPPPKRSQLPVPIPEHPVLKGRKPVAIEAPQAVASHLPVPMAGVASADVSSRVIGTARAGGAVRRAGGPAPQDPTKVGLPPLPPVGLPPLPLPPGTVVHPQSDKPNSWSDVFGAQGPPIVPAMVDFYPVESTELFDNPGMGFQRFAPTSVDLGPPDVHIDGKVVSSKHLYVRLFWSGLEDASGNIHGLKSILNRLPSDVRLSLRIMPYQYNMIGTAPYGFQGEFYDASGLLSQTDWDALVSTPADWQSPLNTSTGVLPPVTAHLNWDVLAGHAGSFYPELNDAFKLRAERLFNALKDELKRSIGTSMRGLGRQKYAARRTGNQVSSRRLAV